MYQLHYLDAPFALSESQLQYFKPAPQNGKTWWDLKQSANGEIEYEGIEKTLEYIKETIQKNGPIEGVFGFSQGAILASLLSQHPDFENQFKFFVLVSGFQPRILEMKKCKKPSLHVIGNQDQWVRPEQSEELMAYYDDPAVYKHSGGHIVPQDDDALVAYHKFFSNQ